MQNSDLKLKMRTGIFTRENGSENIDKEEVSAYTWMVPNTKDIGTKIKDKALVDISMKKVQSLKVNGSRTK